ncbi:MAG: hypothetical protein FWG77_05485, partial [Treponema sp.]|nr:hypothetical protein [Treponema sp.]
EGVTEKVSSYPDVIMEGGAYLPTEIFNNNKWQEYLQAKIDGNKSNSYRWFRKWELSYGFEVEENYPLDGLKGLEIIKIPQSRYIVFNCRQNSDNTHDEVINSTWSAQKDYDTVSHGLKWAIDKIPYFEAEDKEIGYTLLFPVSEI